MAASSKGSGLAGRRNTLSAGLAAAPDTVAVAPQTEALSQSKLELKSEQRDKLSRLGLRSPIVAELGVGGTFGTVSGTFVTFSAGGAIVAFVGVSITLATSLPSTVLLFAIDPTVDDWGCKIGTEIGGTIAGEKSIPDNRSIFFDWVDVCGVTTDCCCGVVVVAAVVVALCEPVLSTYEFV